MPASPSVVFGIKVLDIGYLTALYFALGFAASLALDRAYGEFDLDRARATSVPVLALQATGQLWVLGVVVYALRNLVGALPFPLDGVAGFDHARVREVQGSAIVVFALLLFQNNMAARLKHLYDRVRGRAAPASPSWLPGRAVTSSMAAF